MNKKAIHYYNKGYNCSQCILKAAEEYFNLKVPKECYDLCKGINVGLGIGSTCSVIEAATMIFGLMFDERTVKILRIKFIDKFQKEYGVVNCSQLRKIRNKYGNCRIIIEKSAIIIKELIEKNKKIF
ncbi:C-GCAxxG-C-C family (seleno)protein [Defluviitalea phaphyphila]|uniref:C-GCAxxG-C-C family (seleno)protein n=1 Tax=Defluviitalea phaphyphila TaxID=1473580 RepID=UPI00072FCADA|nr:C-GCAxxG-C-C family (seleno)protein [Defluviitalea phaphyphila]